MGLEWLVQRAGRFLRDASFYVAGGAALAAALWLGGCEKSSTPPDRYQRLTAFLAEGGKNRVTLSWQLSEASSHSSDLDNMSYSDNVFIEPKSPPQVKIVRKFGSYPSNFTDGTVVFEGGGTSFVDNVNGDYVSCYYTAFLKTLEGRVTSQMQALGTTTDATPPAQPSNFVSSYNFSDITKTWTAGLSWTNPADSDFGAVVIKRKVGSQPADQTDGDTVYEGSSQSCTDSGLSDGDYYYTIFARDTQAEPNFSSGATLHSNMDTVFAVGWIGGGVDGWQTGFAPSSGTNARSFDMHQGICVANGFIYVADSWNDRICKWGVDGNFAGWIGGGIDGWQTGFAPSSGNSPKHFRTPTGVSVANGFIYVADSWNHRICKWGVDGNFAGWIGGGNTGWQTSDTTASASSGLWYFDNPRGIRDIILSTYIVDSSNNRLCSRSPDGNSASWLGGGYNGWQATDIGAIPAGQDFRFFSNPSDMFIRNSFIYVADTGNHRISRWHYLGSATGWIGGGTDGWKTTTPGASLGTDTLSFSSPEGVFLDSEGNIYVADSGNHRISKWDINGNNIGWFGSGVNGWQTADTYNADADYRGFNDPKRLVVEPDGTIYIVDMRNNRISKWKD